MVACSCVFGVLYVLSDAGGGAGGWEGGDGAALHTTRLVGLDGARSVGGGGGEGGGGEGGGERGVVGADQMPERLLSSSYCTGEVNNGGIMVLYICGVLYCFLGLAIVCDEFFQTSLEIISEVLKLTPDVAGATFLAAGSSAPELFTSLADAFGDANSTGTGTIVGSAMFNILVIVALSAAVAGKNGSSINIDWRPVCRDIIFYSYSILVLALVFLDSEVQWWEGLIMTLSYTVYIVFMKYNSRILSHCQPPKIGITDEQQLAAAAPGDVAAAVAAVSAVKRPSQGGEETAKVTPLPQGSKEAVAAPTTTAEEENGAELAAAVALVGGNANANTTANSGASSRKSVTLGIRKRVERRKSGGAALADAEVDAAGSIVAGSQEKKGADQNQTGAAADEENGGGAAAELAAGVGAAGGGGGEAAPGGAAAGGGEDADKQEESRFAWPDKLVDQVGGDGTTKRRVGAWIYTSYKHAFKFRGPFISFTAR